MEDIGKLLFDRRNELGLSLNYIADILKIRKRYLESIENSSNIDLPPQIYIILYIKSYADFLGLDGPLIVEKYKSNLKSEEIGKMPTSIYKDSKPNIFIIILAIFLSISIYTSWSNTKFKDDIQYNNVASIEIYKDS